MISSSFEIFLKNKKKQPKPAINVFDVCIYLFKSLGVEKWTSPSKLVKMKVFQCPESWIYCR